MKVQLNREQLQHAFQTAASVISTRTPKEILRNVKLDIQPDGAQLTATDLEIALRMTVNDVQVEQPGQVLLSADQFGSILRESTDEQLSIETDSSGVVIKGERSRFRLPSADPAEFPTVPERTGEQMVAVSGRLLRDLIRRTLFATDTESSRYALGGVLLEPEEDRITAVATDGRRLAKMEGPARCEGGTDSSDAMTIVPARCLQIIDRALHDLDAELQLATEGNSFYVNGTGFSISTRLVEGRYPRWRDVLPKRNDAVQLDLTVGPLLAGVRQAAIVADDDSRGIDFTFGNGMLVLQGTSPNAGESRVELPIAYEGPEVVLRLDHRFVSDFLRVLDPEQVVSLNIQDADSAALFETLDGYVYVVMPLAREAMTPSAVNAASS